ncbi:MAG: leucyl/phenylalanyl-tRNA--protein transferase [Rhodothalassiaceae bacterium]
MHGLTPEMLLHAYACGVFPMAESAHGRDIYWVDPERRGILPLERFHVPRRLRRTVLQDRFRVTIDRDFRAVIEACAAPAPGRSGTWINREIIALYCRLHARGGAHSVECWQGESLAGGLYGVALGGAFFGESMFHRARDASKVALVHLAGRLVAGAYRLLDAQFISAHLKQFGAVEITRARYHTLLADALSRPANFYSLPESASGAAVLQAITQTS